MATIYDIANRAGVAISTVSNVLSGKKFVSEEIRQKVLLVCEEMNFKPNYMASSLVEKKSGIIGLFFESTKIQFGSMYMNLIKGISTEIAKNGYSPLLIFNFEGGDEKNKRERLFTKSALMEGAIVLAPETNDYRVKKLVEDGLPVVIIGDPPTELGAFTHIDTDTAEITYLITKKLLQNGHRRIVFVNGPLSLTVCQDRLKGYEKAFEEYGASYRKDEVLCNIFEEKELYRILDNLYAENPFTACICESNSTAKILYQFVKRQGMKIGENFAVSSLGGSDNDVFYPSLTTVYVDYEDVGKTAAKFLMNTITTKMDPKIFVQKQYLIREGKSSDFVYKKTL